MLVSRFRRSAAATSDTGTATQRTARHTTRCGLRKGGEGPAARRSQEAAFRRPDAPKPRRLRGRHPWPHCGRAPPKPPEAARCGHGRTWAPAQAQAVELPHCGHGMGVATLSHTSNWAQRLLDLPLRVRAAALQPDAGHATSGASRSI